MDDDNGDDDDDKDEEEDGEEDHSGLHLWSARQTFCLLGNILTVSCGLSYLITVSPFLEY